MEKKLAVGLVYNLKKPPDDDIPIDTYAEFESQETVDEIAAALRSLNYEVHLFPFHDLSIIPSLQSSSVDLFFNIAEGFAGGRNRESLIPALLELSESPYSGSDPTILGLTLDKFLAKKVVSADGVPVPRGVSLIDPTDSQIKDLIREYGFPLVVKPRWEGSSKGIAGTSLVACETELLAEVNKINHFYSQPALVEEFLPGREFSVGIIGNGVDARIFPILEVVCPDIPLEDFIYSYEIKSGNKETLVCPCELESDLDKELETYALQVFSLLGCQDLGRADFRLDRNGKPRFLEINPLPGLSKDSLYPLMARAAGLSFPELLEKIIETAVKRITIEKEATGRD